MNFAGNLSSAVATSTGLDYASGTATRNGAVLDMQGYEGARIVVKFAAIADAATTSVKLQDGAAANLSDAADLAGTAVTIASTDDNRVVIFDVRKPLKRYLRVVVTKDGTNAAAETALYEQYETRHVPVTQGSGVTVSKLVSPAEGTA